MGRTQPASGLTVEILVEQDVVLEMRVRLQLVICTKDGPPSLLVAAKNIRQTVPEIISNLFKRQQSAGPDRAFQPKALAIESAELAQAFDNQVVHRNPDRSTP